MKKFKQEKRTKTVDVPTGVECDVCKKVYDVDDFATQEILSIQKEYGYGSTKFGDMNEIELDICEECVFKLLGPYCRINENMPKFLDPME